MVVILETEISAALFRTVRSMGCALLVLNGRISDRAWPRYRRLRFLFRHVLSEPALILAQSEKDRQRYIELGAPPARVTAGGNLKYDSAPAAAGPPEAVATFVSRARPSAVWIAASTMGPADPGDVDEDDAVIAAFRAISAAHSGLLLILRPRKPERFDSAAAKLASARVPHVRRSELDPDSALDLPGVLLLDSMGELSSLFPLADVVFMGGTLARRGGHNILEPAAAGRPVIVGLHMENFAEIAAEFIGGEAVVRIETAAELAPAVCALLDSRRERAEIGARARSFALAKRGAAARAVAAIIDARDLAVPNFAMRGPAWPVLKPLSWLWSLGDMLKRRSDTAHARALSMPVISVGGISMGGTGKTPIALFLARLLSAARLHAAILTRGYGRKSPSAAVIVPAGAQAAVDMTGDEAQIFVQEATADIGIGADRYRTGRLLESLTGPRAFILDDGFQHRRLNRDCDIVLIDALDPFAGGDVFPAGRLREPLEALARADAFIITRAEPGRMYRGIRRTLAHHNSRAPVFRSRAVPCGWIDHATGRAASLPAGPAVAFCGIGNPHSFWQTLRDLGIEPNFAWAFNDHHRYNTRELQRLSYQARRRGAQALLTTRKDSINLPPNAVEVAAPARILWLDIDAEVFEKEEFLRFVMEKIGK